MPRKNDIMSGRDLDIIKLIKVLIRNIWVILLCGGIAFSGMYFYVEQKPDTYTASAMLYVYTNNPNQVNYQYTDQTALNTATRLMETYMVVIRSKKVMEAVASRVQSQKVSANYVAASLRVEGVANTEVMRVLSTTHDPVLSAEICNAVAEVAPDELLRVVNAGLVQVIDYAIEPMFANDKRAQSNGMMAALTGMAVAAMVIAIWFKRDRRVRTETDLSEYFTCPTLVGIPKPKPAGIFRKKWEQVYDASQVDPETMQHRSSEVDPRVRRYVLTLDIQPDVLEIHRFFRINLDAIMKDASNNVLVVSSAIPSEGKSVVSANLGIIMAQDNRRVLLIDTYAQKPALYSLFGMGIGAKGLSDVLAGECAFDQAVLRQVRPGLDLLRSGAAVANLVELYNSKAMDALLSQLHEQYDLIIMDTAPMNVVSDPLVLAKRAAGVVMVARRNVSDINEIGLALTMTEQIGIHVFGFALTDAKGNQVSHNDKWASYFRKYKIGSSSQLQKQLAFIEEEELAEDEEDMDDIA